MIKTETPEALHQALADGFNSKDIDALLDIYEENGSLVPQPGQVATGKDELKAALIGFLTIVGKMEVETKSIVENGDVALTVSSWKIVNGKKVIMASMGSELMRKQANGNWLFVVDNPFAS